MTTKKDYDIKNLDAGTQDAIGRLKNHQSISQNRGINGGKMIEPVPLFDASPTEHVICGDNNTWIVLGRDRPSNRASGAGGRGASQAGAIDIVVGRMGGSSVGVNNNYVAPNFFTDAARIHISQKTNIDDNFALAPGSVGMKKNVSGIGVKADEVRVIGRTGVKIVTGGGRGVTAGKSGEKTGQGGEINYIPTIDLIAGNDTDDLAILGPKKLQPLVKGDNLVECLQEIIKSVNDLQTVVYNMFTNQSQFNQALMYHTHIATAPGAPVVPSVMLNLAGISKLVKDATKVVNGAVAHRVNNTFLELEYLNPASDKYICSRHVNTT